eukprot:349604-Chlamydomonas_euryale.AAC.5
MRCCSASCGCSVAHGWHSCGMRCCSASCGCSAAVAVVLLWLLCCCEAGWRSEPDGLGFSRVCTAGSKRQLAGSTQRVARIAAGARASRAAVKRQPAGFKMPAGRTCAQCDALL